MAANFPYTRVAGRLRGLLRGATLWAGPDHFLSVKNARFTETYHRYYYADIQLLTLRKAPRLVFPMPYLFLLLLLCTVAIAATVNPLFGPGWAWWLAALAVFAGVTADCLLFSCVCHIQTAVGRQALPSLYRMRTARLAIAEMTARIEAQQGVMPPEWSEHAEIQALPASPTPPVEEYVSPQYLWVAFVAFASMLVSAGLASARLQPALPANFGKSSLLFAVPVAAALVATLTLVRSAEIFRNLRILVIVSIVFIGGMTYAHYMLTTVGAAFNAAPAKPFSVPSNRPLDWTDFVGGGVLGVAGLMVTAHTRQQILERAKWQG